MYKSIYFTLSLLALPLTLAGPSHGNSALRPAHRRHHARHAQQHARHAVAAGQPRNSPARRAREEQFEKRVEIGRRGASTTSVECDDGDEYENDATNTTTTTTTTITNTTATDMSGSCTTGNWHCQGAALHHCDNKAWVFVANCTGEDLVCSDDPAQTGCIWSWDLKNSTSTSTPSSGSTGSTSSADDDEEDCEDDDDDSTSGSTSSASNSSSNDDDEDCDDGDDDATPSSTSGSQSASITAAPTESASVIGGNLWAGASQSQGSNGNGKGRGKHHKSSSTNDWNNWGSSSSASDDWSDWSSASSSDNSWDSWSTSSSDNWWDSASSSTNDWSASSTQAWSSASPTHKSGKSGNKHNNGGNGGNSPSASSSAGSSWNNTSGGSSGGQSSGGGSNGNWQAPHYVIYADEWLNTMPDASDIGSYNRFILAFWMSGGSGAVDDAQAWEQFSDSYRQQILTEYHNAGIALMVSAFGSTDAPTTNGADATQTAQALASWVKQYGLDGVDIDYEDMQAMNGNYAESWLITFQQELRNSLGSGYLISHAPVAPWFTSSNAYSSGAYVKIQQEVGDTIDFYNVQFYNQGNGVYTDCNSLIFNSGGDWPSTSVMEINSYAGVPLNKIVIGKPNDAGAADNGYMSPSDLANCVGQAQQKGWNGGVMFWEWANNHQSLLADVNISA